MIEGAQHLTASHAVSGHQWRWASSSRQGQNHVTAQIECQDAHRIRELSLGVLIAAVADGAGSASKSRDGANAAVDILCDFLARFLVPSNPTEAELADLLKRAFFFVGKAIQDAADHDKCSLADYHTTLSCAVATPDALAVAQVGDGAIVCWDDPGKLQTVSYPEHGEYANSTFFVTELPYRQDHLHIVVSPRRCQGIALTTDGLIDIAFEDPLGGCKPWTPFFGPLIDRVANAPLSEDLNSRMDAFLGSAKIRESTTDDLTLVIAVRQTSADEAGSAEGSPNVVMNGDSTIPS